MKLAFTLIISSLLLSIAPLSAQTDQRIYRIIESVEANRIKKDVQALVDFGTRHTLSDTLSATRGIGAARLYIKKEFDQNFLSKQKILESLVDLTGKTNLLEERYDAAIAGLQRSKIIEVDLADDRISLQDYVLFGRRGE